MTAHPANRRPLALVSEPDAGAEVSATEPKPSCGSGIPKPSWSAR